MIDLAHVQPLTRRLLMYVNKRAVLKKSVKLNALAGLCKITPDHLSRIIHNHVKPSQDLAERLAVSANILCGSVDYFTAADFIPTRFREKQ